MVVDLRVRRGLRGRRDPPVGFVTASCILQLAIVVGKVDLDEVHQYVEGERLVAVDTLWSVFKPATNPKTTDGRKDRPAKN